MPTDDGAEVGRGGNRTCTNCGQDVEDESYELWLFHTCRACALDATPARWGETGTSRKWRYFPRWHLTQHPGLPEHVRARHGGASA